jgi:large subunit ribosomal protein L29
MKIKELRQKTEKELKDILAENRTKLGKLKFDLASKKLKNVSEIKELRREIARILTILNKKDETREEK